MADAHANFGYSTVTVAPSPASSGSTLTIADGTVCPATPFNATVWVTGAAPLNSNAEIVRVTARSGNDLTITRAQEGTSARTIVVGDQFAVSITAKTLTDAELSITDGVASVGSGTLRLTNANGVTFTVNGQTLSASVATSYRASNDAAGLNSALTAGPLAWTVNSAGISLNAGSAAGTTSGFAGNLISGSLTHNTAGLNVSLDHPAWLTTAMASNAATLSNIRVSAGTTSNVLSALTIADGNGISFGLNASTITASYTVPTVTNSSMSVSDAATSGTLARLAFTNLNGVTLSLSTGAGGSHTIVGSHNALTSQSNQAFSADASSTFQTLTFQDSNGVSFSNNAGALRVTHALQFTSATSAITSAALHSSASRVINIVAATNNTGGGTASLSSNVSFSNANGATFYTSAGGAVALSYTVPAGGGAAISGGANSQNTGTVNFANSNGITFGLSNNGTMTASHNGLTTARASNDGLGTNTAQTNVTWTANSGGLSLNAAGYAGTATTFAGANISASFTLNSVGLNMSASVAAPGAAAENNAINLLGANTAGNTTATGSTIGWSGVNLTLSGANASQVVISAPATSSLSATGILSISTNGSTISLGVPAGTATMWQPFNEGVNVLGQQGQATMQLVPLPTPVPAALGELHVDRLVVPLYWSNSSNSTGTVTLSMSFGLYTKTASTLSLAMSTSYSTAWTFSGTVSAATYNGIRLHTIPWTTTIGDGRYYVAQWVRTTTGGGNGTLSQVLVSQINSNFSGVFGVASNRSYQWPAGYGVYSASITTAMPSSVVFSQIDGTASLAARPPSFFMINGTV